VHVRAETDVTQGRWRGGSITSSQSNDISPRSKSCLAFIAQAFAKGSAQGVIMPKLERSQWYDLCRDMNWQFKYVTEAELFPEALSQSQGIPAAAWWNWDEPYKIS
jgi:hypothetical protein